MSQRLQEGVMSRIYMDYNATTPVAEEVTEIVLQVMRGSYGNASSVHAEGRHARQVVRPRESR